MKVNLTNKEILEAIVLYLSTKINCKKNQVINNVSWNVKQDRMGRYKTNISCEVTLITEEGE